MRTSHAYGSSGATATARSAVQPVPSSYRSASSADVKAPPSRRAAAQSSIAPRHALERAPSRSGGASSDSRRRPSSHWGRARSRTTPTPRLVRAPAGFGERRVPCTSARESLRRSPSARLTAKRAGPALGSWSPRSYDWRRDLADRAPPPSASVMSSVATAAGRAAAATALADLGDGKQRKSSAARIALPFVRRSRSGRGTRVPQPRLKAQARDRSRERLQIGGRGLALVSMR